MTPFDADIIYLSFNKSTEFSNVKSINGEGMAIIKISDSLIIFCRSLDIFNFLVFN